MTLRQRLSDITSSFRKSRRARPVDRNRRRRLTLERMEERRVLATIELASLTASQGFTIFGADSADFSGGSVSGAGDVNGDGFEDFIIGATNADGVGGARSTSGESYLIFGSQTPAATLNLGTLGASGVTFLGIAAFNKSGNSVRAAGDVNGDGFGDLIIGASGVANSAGESYLVFGSKSLPATIDLADFLLPGNTAGVRFFGGSSTDFSGNAVSSAGDMNGDGFDDLVIAAFNGDGAGDLKPNSGESYVVFGAASFPPSINLANLGTNGITIFGADANDKSGASVSRAGDVNADGFDDIIIGANRASGANNLSVDTGESYIIYGKATLPSIIDLAALGTAGTVVFGINTSDSNGTSVSNAGDVNGDGFDDVLIGAPAADALNNGKPNAGESYLIFGKAAMPLAINLSSLGSAGVVLFGADADDASGHSVSTAGDVNADGFDDLLIGSRFADGVANTRASAGETYIVFGSSSLAGTIDLGNPGSLNVTIFGAKAGDASGGSVQTAGDVNGDGFDDLIIGAQSGDAPGPNSTFKNSSGISYVLFGGNNFTSSVTIPGTNVGETLNGTTGADIIVGGLGNDILNGKGGTDVLIGGRGNDILSISSLNFRKLNAGTGNDTLRISGSGLFLELSEISDNKIEGIETIDITGTGNNGLTLTARDVLNLSGTSNTLTVKANAGDIITSFERWTQAANQTVGGNTFQIFRSGAATLRIPLGLQFTSIDVSIFGALADDFSGTSLSNAGDINGDGFDDLIIGAENADPPSRGNAGVSYVIFGGAAVPASIDLANLGTSGIMILGAESVDASGSAVSSAGDVNADGFDDIFIGARFSANTAGTKSSVGESYLIFGGAALPSTIDLAALGSLGTTFLGIDTGDNSGASLSDAGDVNGDGFDDLIIGASNASASSNAKGGAGESYVIFGKSLMPATINLANLGSAGFRIFGADAGDASSISVSKASDVNGDGLGDLVVGAFLASGQNNAKPESGESYIIFGKASFGSTINLATLAATAGVKIFGADELDRSGSEVSAAGDVNGDGFDDVIIGAPSASGTSGVRQFAGESYIVFGSASLPATINLGNLGTKGLTIFGADAQDESGTSVSAAGDINGDGFDDVIIGARDAYSIGNSKPDGGESYLIFGASTLPNAIDLANLGTAGVTFFSQDANDGNGIAVSGAGDVNGDGFDDLFVAAPLGDGASNLRRNSGESYVIFGGTTFLNSVTQKGSDVADSFTGSAAVDVIIGGRGNDILRGKGGADVLRGGQGNDVLSVDTLNFKKAVGGTGNDTLRVEGTGQALDLTTLRDNRLQSIETIDITGTGNNTLTLNKLEVLNLSDSSNTLTVRRNFGDVVNQGAGWAQQVDQIIGGITFEVFTQGAARLNVQRVSSPPVIGAFDTAITYAANSPAIFVDSNATVADTDSANFNDGTLTLSIAMNAESTDRFIIRNQGIASGQVGVTGNDVTFGGVLIGTKTGGSGATPLVINLNANATVPAVQALLRSVSWRSTAATPSILARKVTVSLTDGDGGTSVLQTKQINVTL